MNLELQDRIALVTGGSKGIGASIVRTLAAEGARVAFCARPSAAMTELETEVRRSGGICLGVPVDVNDSAAAARTVEAAATQWGGLDILINNVGGAVRFGSFEDLTDSDWLCAFELNVMSCVRFTRAALPHLRKSPLRRIVNVSSISALQPGRYNPHYTTTKAAVVNLGKCLANALAGERILVNTVCPGPVHSASWASNVRHIAKLRDITEVEAKAVLECEEAAKVPLGRVGEGEQIAATVALLCSPISDWTTGSCVHVNGGKMAAAI